MKEYYGRDSKFIETSIKRHTQTKKKEMERDIALIDLEGIMLNEICATEKNMYMCNPKNKIKNNNNNRNKLIDEENILRAIDEGVGGQ